MVQIFKPSSKGSQSGLQDDSRMAVFEDLIIHMRADENGLTYVPNPIEIVSGSYKPNWRKDVDVNPNEIRNIFLLIKQNESVAEKFIKS